MRDDIFAPLGLNNTTGSSTPGIPAPVLHAFSSDGRISQAAYKRMTDALVDWGDLKEPVPPASKFFDLSFVEAAWK